MDFVNEAGNYKNITASTTIRTGPGNLLGIFVASASATPTIKVTDDTTGSTTTIVNTFTPIAGTFYPMPFSFTTALRVTISGTVDCTVSWNSNGVV
jgi:hypothetical protein